MYIYQNYSLKELSGLHIPRQPIVSLDDSYNYVKYLAQQHYENFPVGSILIPKSIRKYFYSIYSFSRLADDIADESYIENAKEKLETLEKLQLSIETLLKTGEINNPILLSLKDTITKFDLPIKPFVKLISAFKQDVNFSQASNWADILDYCDNSANPVGELLLRLFNEFTPENKILSDKICTGLQLINFWQDFSRDLKIGRCYIPKDILDKHNIIFYENKLIDKGNNLNHLLKEIYDATSNIYNGGKSLPNNINDFKLKYELKAIISGGEKVFSKIKKIENKILIIRPKVTKFEFFKILFRMFL